MPDGSSPRTDLGLALFLIVVCAVVLFETRDIPPGTFEPLGSAPIPQATAGLIILCSLIVMARAVLQTRRGAVETADDELELRPRDAALVLGLTVVYVLMLQFRLLDFAPLTVLFLIASIGLLVRFERRQLPWVVLVALVMGYGCQYLFTRVFVVDLPGL
ncbi:MAG: tripartite tricarboxylate transporter TctB family protein [Geminicoccaceae bacterium]|nr:tripartite tricarboxylate transporter TctB family protein [Geminicoccaceae bacterium]